MIMLAALLLGLVTIPLAGGSFDRIGDLRFRANALLLAALGLQLTIIVVWAAPPAPAAVIHLLSYVAAGGWLVANLRVPGLPLVAAGGGMNAAAIAANDGVMPADPRAVEIAGLVHDPTVFANSSPIADAPLWMLGDVFAVPASWPLANVFSVGDVVLVVGGLWLLHRAAGSRLGRPDEAPAAALPA